MSPPPPPAPPPPAPVDMPAAVSMATPPPLRLRVKRHPIRGLLGGLLLGIGLALLVLVYAKAPFGIATPYVCLGAGIVAGLAMGLSGPVRRPGADN